MVMAKRRMNRVREEAVAYRARSSDIVVMPWSSLEVGERCMETLKARAKSVSEALRRAGVPHAVVGGLSVAAHVASVDEAAVRNTRDLDILLKRTDLDRAAAALKPLGYIHRKVMGISAFLPTARTGGKSRFAEGIHVVFASERVRPEYVCPAPDLAEDAVLLAREGYACLAVKELVRMKLTSYRHKDIVHIQDLMDQRLITKKVEAALPVELRNRLEQVKRDTERERLG
jgi:hypothetical protein